MIMNKLAVPAGAVALVLALGPAAAQEKVVNVYNWSDYIDESILEDFQKETGIRVVYDVFDSNEVLETKLLAGGTGYDVVVPTGSFLARSEEHTSELQSLMRLSCAVFCLQHKIK